MKKIFILAALLFASTAQAQSTLQVNAACAAALLFVASHQRTSQADKNRYTTAGFKFMQKIPAQYHSQIDVGIAQFAYVPYAEAKAGADSCMKRL